MLVNAMQTHLIRLYCGTEVEQLRVAYIGRLLPGDTLALSVPHIQGLFYVALIRQGLLTGTWHSSSLSTVTDTPLQHTEDHVGIAHFNLFLPLHLCSAAAQLPLFALTGSLYASAYKNLRQGTSACLPHYVILYNIYTVISKTITACMSGCPVYIAIIFSLL